MKKLFRNSGGLVVCLFEILVGILVLINPVGFTSGIIMAAGIVLMITGLIDVIKYFRQNVEEAAVGQTLMKGLIALLGGAFCAFKSHWFVVTFPVLTILYGIAMLVTGVGKIQLAVDMLRRKNGKWFLGAISALVSIICAVVILNSPFTSTAVLWMFTGITLIVESVFDLVTLILGRTKARTEPEDEAEAV